MKSRAKGLSSREGTARRYGLLRVASLLAALVWAGVCYGLPLGRGVVGSAFYVATIAGDGTKGYLDGPARRARFNWPTGVAVSRDGTIFVADFANNMIRRIDGSGSVSTFAGSVVPGFSDGRGTGALLHGPDNIAMDASGNIFVADADNYRIRRISPDGVVSTVAGSGISGYRDGPAGEAMFGYPTGIAVDKDGVLYVADRRTHTVRKVTPDGLVVTIAGNGHPGYADGRSTASLLREPISVAVAEDGIVYVADSGNNLIRMIGPDGTVKTLAGGLARGYRDGPGSEALFNWPTGIAVDPQGNLYVCDSGNNKIRRITPTGTVSTVAGSLTPGSADGHGLRSGFNFPTGIAVDRFGTIYVADSGNNMIRRITHGRVREAALGPVGLPEVL